MFFVPVGVGNSKSLGDIGHRGVELFEKKKEKKIFTTAHINRGELQLTY